MDERSGSKALPAETVRRYYEETHEAYLADVGTTLQGALFKLDDPDRRTRNNELLARYAKLAAGDLVLDAGSGFCGPSVDIACSHAGVRIVSMTLSVVQARVGRARIADARLESAVRVVLGDYHEPPFAAATFDHVLFLESFGHSYDQPRVLRSMLEVLKPGGRLFIKDFFVPDRELTLREAGLLEDWDATFRHDTQTVDTTLRNLRAAGFEEVRPWDVTHLVDFQAARDAMHARADGEYVLTEYGKLHAAMLRHECFPLRVVLLRARKPAATRAIAER